MGKKNQMCKDVIIITHCSIGYDYNMLALEPICPSRKQNCEFFSIYFTTVRYFGVHLLHKILQKSNDPGGWCVTKAFFYPCDHRGSLVNFRKPVNK